MLELQRARDRYGKATKELADAREEISNEATLARWLGDGNLTDAANDALAGRSGSDPSGRPGLAFTRVIEALEEDAAHLTGQPDRRQDPPPKRPRPNIMSYLH